MAEYVPVLVKEHIQKKFPILETHVLTMGSYIQDLKVFKTDEFDFLFVFEKACEEQQEICLEIT